MKTKFLSCLMPVFTLAFLAPFVRANPLVSLAGLLENEDPWETTLSTTLMTRYYGTIVGGIFYSGPMSFTTLGTAREDLLGSTRFAFTVGRKLDSFRHDSRDGGHENGISFNRRLSKSSFPVNVDIGFVYQMLGRLNRSADDVLQSYAKVAFTRVPGIEPYVQFCQFNRVGQSSIDPGWFLYGGFIRSQDTGIKLGEKKKLIAMFDFRTGYSDNVFGAERGWAYHRLSVSLPFQFDKWDIIPCVVGQIPAGGQSHDRAFARENRAFGELTVARRF
jgi:hypothetical protein